MASTMTIPVDFHMITEYFQYEICNLQEFESNVGVSQDTERYTFFSPFKKKFFNIVMCIWLLLQV